MRHSIRIPVLLACTGFALGCAGARVPGLGRWLEPPAPAALESSDAIDPAVYERAQAERSEFFEREVERLRADLHQAEASIVALESGLRNSHSRANAVSALAEARIALDRVSRNVPWRTERVGEARTKLEEAGHQLDAGHVGAAVFFASRARRITEALDAEARQVALWGERLSIRGERVNLRAGPSETHRVVDVLLRETPVYPRAHARGLDAGAHSRRPDRLGLRCPARLASPRFSPGHPAEAPSASGSKSTTQSLPSAFAR